MSLVVPYAPLTTRHFYNSRSRDLFRLGQQSNRSARLAARRTGVQWMDEVKPANACVSLKSPHPRRNPTIKRTSIGTAVDLDRTHAAFKFANIDRRREVGVTAAVFGAFKKVAQLFEKVCKHDVLP